MLAHCHRVKLPNMFTTPSSRRTDCPVRLVDGKDGSAMLVTVVARLRRFRIGQAPLRRVIGARC